jgi:hypothetical protein
MKGLNHNWGKGGARSLGDTSDADAGKKHHLIAPFIPFSARETVKPNQDEHRKHACANEKE